MQQQHLLRARNVIYISSNSSSSGRRPSLCEREREIESGRWISFSLFSTWASFVRRFHAVQSRQRTDKHQWTACSRLTLLLFVACPQHKKGGNKTKKRPLHWQINDVTLKNGSSSSSSSSFDARRTSIFYFFYLLLRVMTHHDHRKLLLLLLPFYYINIHRLAQFGIQRRSAVLRRSLLLSSSGERARACCVVAKCGSWQMQGQKYERTAAAYDNSSPDDDKYKETQLYTHNTKWRLVELRFFFVPCPTTHTQIQMRQKHRNTHATDTRTNVRVNVREQTETSASRSSVVVACMCVRVSLSLLLLFSKRVFEGGGEKKK